MQIRFTPSLNRCMALTVYPKGLAMNFSVMYHNRNAALQFGIDNQSPAIKDSPEKISVVMLRKMEKCKFATTFLNISSIKNDTFDYEGKFNGLNPDNEKNVITIAREKHEFNTYLAQLSGKANSKNALLILGFKLVDVDTELLYYYVQRKTYNPALRKHIIRSASIQFCTEAGYQSLCKYHDSYSIAKSTEKAEKDSIDNLDIFDSSYKEEDLSNSTVADE